MQRPRARNSTDCGGPSIWRNERRSGRFPSTQSVPEMSVRAAVGGRGGGAGCEGGWLGVQAGVHRAAFRTLPAAEEERAGAPSIVFADTAAAVSCADMIELKVAIAT